MPSKIKPNMIIFNDAITKGGSKSSPFSFLALPSVCFFRNRDSHHDLEPIALGKCTLSSISGFYEVMTTHFATFDPARLNLTAYISCEEK